MRSRRVAIYGDVDLNYVDGSAIWLTSLCSVLELLDGIHIDLVLKAPIERDLLTSELGDRVVLHVPDRKLTHDQVIDNLTQIDRANPFDVLIVRGRRISHRIVQDGRFASRMWAYLTDVPQNRSDLPSPEGTELRHILAGAGRLLCQTEDMRAWFASVDPDSDDRLLLLPPMVPDAAFNRREHHWLENGLKLFYAGKFAPDWGFVEVVEQVAALRRGGVDVSLVVAGDKVHDPPSDPSFASSVRKALAADFVTWKGAVRRSEVFRLLDDVDLALSVRTSALDESRELSTKVLEYSAAGVPVVANRTLAHVELFGHDYPFLVSDFGDLQGVVEAVVSRSDLLGWASKRVQGIGARFSFQRAAQALDAALDQLPGNRRGTDLPRPRLLVAGHDLKFIKPLIEGWRVEGLEVSVDRWRGHNRHDPEKSLRHLKDADVVVCEWMLGNADFYSREAPSETGVIVRLHRMELTTDWPSILPVDRIDRIVTVSEHIKAELTSKFGVPSSKVVVIPNGVDRVAYDRPKLAGAEFTLGMLGYIPRLKRLDRAVGLLRRLRDADPRYRLIVKGRRPEDAAWVWYDQDERYYFEALMTDIRESDLAEAVVFEAAGPNTASWFRKVGYILSPSDLESFHLALFEGMASRAVPVVWDRVGATDLVPSQWVHNSTDEAAEWIISQQTGRGQQGSEASDLVGQRFPIHRVLDRWNHLIDEVVAQAGRGFDGPSGPPSPSYESLVATDIIDDIPLLQSGDDGPESTVRAPFRYPTGGPTEQDQAAVRQLLGGSFQPSPLFEPVEMTMPPDWVTNPHSNRSWDFHRHSLEWLVPLIRVAKHDKSASETLEVIAASWVQFNSKPPGKTPYVWNDHTAAIRARVLLFLLHTLAGQLRETTRALLLASLIQHGAFLADDAHYTVNSNHGLEMDASLLALSLSQAKIRFAPAWKAKAERRLEAYVARNYSRHFVHLEQSPAYHLFVTVRLMSVLSFLRENGLSVPAMLERVVIGAAAVWPYIRRPDGSAPMVGDTPLRPKPVDFEAVYERLLGVSPRSIAPEPLLNPRDDGASAFVDEQAGYALFADASPSVAIENDCRRFQVMVKCNTFESPHYHHDAGSFVIWHEGLDWIVDAGYYSMEERSLERKYMRSARAHNVLMIDDEDFDIRPFSVVDVFRSPSEDRVEMVHELGPVTHCRRVSIIAAKGQVVVRDKVLPKDGRSHRITRLLHLNPRLEVDVAKSDDVRIRGPYGCLVISDDAAADFSIVTGDEDGRPAGWYSEDYQQRVPAPVLRWSNTVFGEVEWTTRLRFAPG